MRALISYFIVFLSSVMYMLLFDKEAGGIMTVFITITPIISLILTCLTKNKLSFSLNTDSSLADKNKVLKCYVNISKDTVLPVPIVSFDINHSERFEKLKQNVYRFSMSENKNLRISIDIIPQICGPGNISVSNIYITDYLGIFKFKINRYDMINTDIFIRPDMKEMEDSGDLLRNLYNDLCDNDDDDMNESISGRSTFPGYEYREYVAGDSLKRINWKLSTKRNKLYVRKDEAAGITIPDIIIDGFDVSFDMDITQKLCMQQKLIESSLALLLLCVKHGIECTYSYMHNGTAKKETVDSVEQIELLCSEMASYSFENEKYDIISREKTKSTDVNIIYTLSYNNIVAENVRKISLNGDNAKVIIPSQLISGVTGQEDVWCINDDYSIIRCV